MLQDRLIKGIQHSIRNVELHATAQQAFPEAGNLLALAVKTPQQDFGRPSVRRSSTKRNRQETLLASTGLDEALPVDGASGVGRALRQFNQ